jgi:hypothetical protein
VVKVTARAADVMTIERAQEGTTAAAWATGDKAELRVTAESLNAFATRVGVEELTNKTLTSPVVNTPTGIVKGDVGLGNVDNTSNATERAATATLTNKTIALGSNTLTGTLAQFNAALSDADFATGGGTATGTNTGDQDISGKQDVLVSGTNIKTLNGTSLLGTGDLAVSSNVEFTQNAQSADYTFVLGDAGKMIFHPAVDTVVRTWTIPANASVAFPIGTVIMFVVQHGANTVILDITSDTLRSVDGLTGAKRLIANTQYLLVKETATEWLLSGGVDVGQFNQQIAIAHTTTPFVSAYPWSASGFGTKFTNPGTLPTGNGIGVAFSPAGTEIAIAHATTPFVSAYPWSASGFGTKFSDPGTLPASTGNGVAFNEI